MLWKKTKHTTDSHRVAADESILAHTAVLIAAISLIYAYVKCISVGISLMFDDEYVFKASDIINLKK